MGLVVSIGETTFGALDSANGKYCMDYSQTPPSRTLRRFHVPGVAGNYIVRDVQSGGKITVRVRYVYSTISDLISEYNTDRDIFLASEMVITDPSSATFDRCNLDADNSGPASEIRPTGSGVFFDVNYQFTVDGI